MNNSIFEFDHLPDENELKGIISDKNDPKSVYYIRQIHRPDINWLKIGLVIATPVILLSLFAVITARIGIPKADLLLISVCLSVIYFFLFLKKGIITLVKIYQRFAPEHLRNKCRFEPSCSQYMILSIEKYGLFKGVGNGIERLKRCNINGGGYDYP